MSVSVEKLWERKILTFQPRRTWHFLKWTIERQFQNKTLSPFRKVFITSYVIIQLVKAQLDMLLKP